MSDALFLVLTVAAFAAAWGLVIGCERLLGEGEASLDGTPDEPAADRSPLGAA